MIVLSHIEIEVSAANASRSCIGIRTEYGARGFAPAVLFNINMSIYSAPPVRDPRFLWKP